MTEQKRSTANEAINFIYNNAKLFAQAKANRIYLEEFRKSKKAILMSQSQEKTAVGREQDAYAHPEYLAVIDGLRTAVEDEEELRWKMIAAQARVEVWRSEEATARAMDRAAA